MGISKRENMENVLPTYSRPFKTIEEPSISVDFWDEAKEAHENKEYRKSLIAVINYLNIDILKEVNLEKDISFTQMHGPIEITITITDKIFRVDVPFLKMVEKTNVIALLRKVAEVNFSRFDLSQIGLDGDDLTIHYEIPLALCHPYKIYTLLREVCFRADEFDDEFIENYHAEFLKELNYKSLTEKEQEKAWLDIDHILDEYERYSSYFKEKQKDGYQWDIEVLSLLKIANMPYVNGVLRYELMEYVDLLFNGDKEFNYRVEKGKNYLKKLAKKSKEEILKNLYHREQFISMLWRSSPDIIAEKLESYHETVERYEKNDNGFALAYYLQGVLLKLIYNYNLDESYKNLIETVLEETSGLKPEDAVSKLLEVYYLMYHKNVEASIAVKDEKESIWSNISTYLYLFFFIALAGRLLRGES